MEKPISQDQLALLRSRLEQQRTRLRADLQGGKTAPVPTESDSQDYELSYVGDLDQKVEVEINQRHIIELRAIEEALQRMDAGHYGVCQDCDATIDIERLTAYPMARRCIDCKQAFEQESAITRNT